MKQGYARKETIRYVSLFHVKIELGGRHCRVLVGLCFGDPGGSANHDCCVLPATFGVGHCSTLRGIPSEKEASGTRVPTFPLKSAYELHRRGGVGGMKLDNIPWSRWIEMAVVGAVIAVVAALFIPAVLHSRDAARKSTSKNNLKQLGLAFHNYHETFGSFSIGATVTENGVALHGWYTRTMPFMDASPLHSVVNFDHPWTDAENAHVFRTHLPALLMPGAREAYTTESLGLMHYLANPNVFHRNSSITIEELEAGAGETWLLGEVAGNFQPWGYPFNWRPLGTQLNAGPDSYGRPTEDGAFFLMGDGSVQEIQNDVDPWILQSMAQAPPIAPTEKTRVPNRRFQCVDDTDETRRFLELNNQDDSGYQAIVRYNASETFYSVWMLAKEKDVPRLVSLEELKRVLEECPHAKQIMGPILLNDEAAQCVSALKRLELLRVREVELSRKGIRLLRQLPKLKIIRGTMTDEMRETLVEELPKCEVRNSPTYY